MVMYKKQQRQEIADGRCTGALTDARWQGRVTEGRRAWLGSGGGFGRGWAHSCARSCASRALVQPVVRVLVLVPAAGRTMGGVPWAVGTMDTSMRASAIARRVSFDVGAAATLPLRVTPSPPRHPCTAPPLSSITVSRILSVRSHHNYTASVTTALPPRRPSDACCRALTTASGARHRSTPLNRGSVGASGPRLGRLRVPTTSVAGRAAAKRLSQS